MTLPQIGYAGMTHLGLNSAVAVAEKGFRVIGYDRDKERIAALKWDELSVTEPNLRELLVKNAHRVCFTANPQDLGECDVVYIASDVPTDDVGKSDLVPIQTLISEVQNVMRSDAVMVILSQVPPGFTRSYWREGCSLYYQVETLIFGRAIERALHPERFIIGCISPHQPLPTAFSDLLESFGCPVLKMRYESAELAKISINLCLVASVSVANTLSELCEKIGADWSEIVPALKLDKRIGEYAYLKPGLGIAGGNLERDLATVCNFADRYGTDARFVRACIANSHYRRDWVLRTLYQSVLSQIENPVIAVLGLAYKENTNSIKNSPAVSLLEYLKSFKVRVFDPMVSASMVSHPNLYGALSELDACEGADVLIVMTPWPQFRELNPVEIAARLLGQVVLDPYALLSASLCQAAGLKVIILGVNKVNDYG